MDRLHTYNYCYLAEYKWHHCFSFYLIYHCPVSPLCMCSWDKLTCTLLPEPPVCENLPLVDAIPEVCLSSSWLDFLSLRAQIHLRCGRLIMELIYTLPKANSSLFPLDQWWTGTGVMNPTFFFHPYNFLISLWNVISHFVLTLLEVFKVTAGSVPFLKKKISYFVHFGLWY